MCKERENLRGKLAKSCQLDAKSRQLDAGHLCRFLIFSWCFQGSFWHSAWWFGFRSLELVGISVCWQLFGVSAGLPKLLGCVLLPRGAEETLLPLCRCCWEAEAVRIRISVMLKMLNFNSVVMAAGLVGWKSESLFSGKHWLGCLFCRKKSFCWRFLKLRGGWRREEKQSCNSDIIHVMKGSAAVFNVLYFWVSQFRWRSCIWPK